MWIWLAGAVGISLVGYPLIGMRQGMSFAQILPGVLMGVLLALGGYCLQKWFFVVTPSEAAELVDMVKEALEASEVA